MIKAFALDFRLNNKHYSYFHVLCQWVPMQYISDIPTVAYHGRPARRARHRDMENALLNLFTA